MLKDICVSLEIASELERDGYPQDDSLFYWSTVFSQIYPEDQVSWGDVLNGSFIAAPTAGEIGMLLPALINSTGLGNCFLEMNKVVKDGGMVVKWGLVYQNSDEDYLFEPIYGFNEANARAKMWLCLKRMGFFNEYSDEYEYKLVKRKRGGASGGDSNEIWK